MAGDESYDGVLDGGISRARFLKLAGLGAGLSFFPGSMFSSGPGMAQAVGVPEILSSDGRYPILVWSPPPPVPKTGTEESDQTSTNALYAELAGAGFNAVLGGNGVAFDRANGLALEACGVNNLRLVLADQALRNAISGTAPAAQSEGEEEPQSALQALTEQDSPQDLQAQAAADQGTVNQRIQYLYEEFGSHPALAGLLLYDEPHRSLFGTLRDAKKEVEQKFGDDELPYVNVWPSHASPKNALGAESYTDYLEKYMNETKYSNAVAPPVLSFDHYPLLTDERTTPDFFYNHAVIRSFALRFGVPSWGFVQSMGFDGRNLGLAVRRRPDEAEIFWQINVALAYGVKGVQYFTYWTPKDNEVKFGNALITREGAQTALYGYATRANDFLRKVGVVLLPLTSASVTHFGERRLPRGARPFRGDSYVKAASGDPAILGSFSDPNAPADRYVLVVNRSPNRKSRTRLTISGTVRSIERFDPSVGETGEGDFVSQPLGGDPPRFLTVSLGAGRAHLYRLRNA
ncbi:MAG: hypothetical protein M3533_02770 [Actinomycetota bacterium]|nr:hypothetical protein [Actinomycetota bacterium]